MGGSTSSSARGARLLAQRRSLDAWQILEYAKTQFPDRLAIVNGNPAVCYTTATYSKLYQHVLHLVGYLRSLGVQRGTRVAVMLRNCSEVIALHYAAAALHAIIVNININLAAQELAYILDDSGAAVVVASPEFAEVLQQAATVATWEREVSPTESARGAEEEAQQLMDLSVRAVVWTFTPRQQQQQQQTAAAADPPTVSTWSSGWYPYGVGSSQQQTFHSHQKSSSAQPDTADSSNSGSSSSYSTAGSGDAEPDEDDGLHMYYTSGTTGRPKGVVLSHKIVVLHAIGTIMGTCVPV